uniref:Syndecan domain-containing protein n=1 Tax=Strongyloides papillosus TaxID=174720 RepID=A0A0N5CIB8_STREA
MIKGKIVPISLIIFHLSILCYVCAQQTANNVQQDHFKGSVDQNLTEDIQLRGDAENRQKMLLDQKQGQETPKLLISVFGGLICAVILTVTIIFAVFYVYKKDKKGSSKSGKNNTVSSSSSTSRRHRR